MIDSKDVSFMIGRLNSCHMSCGTRIWSNGNVWNAGVTLQQVVATDVRIAPENGHGKLRSS